MSAVKPTRTRPLLAWDAIRGRSADLLLRLLEQKVLLPMIAALVLAVIWATTLHVIRLERLNAERAAITSTRELGDTYEAQVLRNLREIDQALKVIAYAYQTTGNARVLDTLQAKGLLPPEMLFSVTLSDPQGKVLASTRAADHVSPAAWLRVGLDARSDELQVSAPQRNPRTGEWQLQFGRPVRDAHERMLVLATLSVDAAYFVSSYETTKLGERGLLGLIGAGDGVFRVRRSGERISSGERTLMWLDGSTASEAAIRRATSPIDGETRFVSMRPLYGFPLQLVVGLSESEQMARSGEAISGFLWRATLASTLLLLFIGVLLVAGRKVAEAGRRESAARAAHAERIQHLAYHDGLTELPNRAFFSRMLEQSIHEARRYSQRLALLFVDIDRFKQINDTLGHHAGDQLLVELGRRLKLSLRESDCVARFGGDEFVVLLPRFDEDRYVATVAQKVLNVIAQPLTLSGHSLIVTGSIGIATYPRDGDDEQALMKCADTAMYHAKGQGKNNYQFFSSSLQTNSLRRLALESSLRLALERNELQVYYQPKVELASNRITGVEALLRWRSAEHGLVSPSEFIPIAEDTGLILPIGRWVLEQACAQSVAWQREGVGAVAVAVNMSARQFAYDSLADDVVSVLARSGLDPRWLEVEITESLLMSNVDRAIRILTRLAEQGVRLSIDDFGTGYSSLSNLKRFPLTTLKIDRAFVSELPLDAESRVLTEAIISIGKALKMRVVAEGVESPEQADFLRRHVCDEYQGYYFSKPLPAGELAALVRGHAVHAKPHAAEPTVRLVR